MMSTTSSVASASSEEEFVRPPPPPPRILLLRGICLGRVLAFLDAADKANAVASCRLFRDASPALDGEPKTSFVPNIEEVRGQVEPLPKQASNKLTITAPPGRLGIRLENTPSKRGTIVSLILEASPLQGKIRGGDMIVSVNGVDVSRMDTYGTLEVFQRFFKEKRHVTFIRRGAVLDDTIKDVDETPSVTDVTCANNNRKAQHEICTSIPSASAQKALGDRECVDSDLKEEADTSTTGIGSSQSKAIARTTTAHETATMTPLFSEPYHGAAYIQLMPFGMPTTIPSSDSDLQLESLDLNSHNSCKSDKDSSGKQSLPCFQSQRLNDVIPFDELEVGTVKLPDFPSSCTDSGYFVPCARTPPGSEADDDDDLTMSSSAGSTYVSSLSTDHVDIDHDEEKADYLAQFADAALFGDATLFTSFVQEIIDSAKDAARLVVPENGNPIDDQGPIKIGDSYYTHREAIQKWKSAREKLKNSKYKHDEAKLQRKLENAAMEAATLMAATKTLDLAARRSGRKMEKKEQKLALKKLLGMDRWNREELEKIRDREKEKEATTEKNKNDAPVLTIHQLVNQFSLFGFPKLDDEDKKIQGKSLDKKDEQEPCKTPVKSRFAFLEEPSAQCSDGFTTEVQKHPFAKGMSIEKEVNENQFQYMTRSSDDEEEANDVGIELSGSNKVVEQELAVFSKDQDTVNEELELEIIEQLKLNAALRAPSPSVSIRSRSFTNLSPSTPISYASEITELAGCGGRSHTGRPLSVASNESDGPTSLGADDSDVEQSDSEYIIDGANVEQSLVSGFTNSSTTSSTDESSVDTSAESSEVLSQGVETTSMFSGDISGQLSRSACSGTIIERDRSTLLSSPLDVLPKPKTPKHGNSQSSTVLVDDSAQVVDEMSGVLLSTVEREESECASDSGAITKVTYDSLIGSQYGTEVVLSASKVDEPVSNHSQLSNDASKEPLRVVTARKPRTLSKHNMGIVTPSPTRKTIALKRSGSQNREGIRSSPLAKRMNPLKLIKAPSSNKETKRPIVNSQAALTEEDSRTTSSSVQVTPKGDKCPKGSLPLKMSFGVMRSRSAVP
ncbi:hypothetical protein HJC23_007047 [Cyclotella cryptica]|uniref:PDZ domain-containing protein n=1 Tax=Cyclotella cryptica TaxID=29204 RepID=A0ABD3PBQ0_9STRA